MADKEPILISKARDAIEKYHMLQHASGVLVALSGGADSVALLHFLLSLCNERGLPLHAVHLNHQLRGEEAECDVAFVQALCEQFDIPLHLYRRDVSALAAERGHSIELTAREERYHIFEQCAAKIGFSHVATAHTASDNLETVLFHLARGTGPTGLSGIPPVRDQYIRPLIHVTRQEVLDYLLTYHLEHREDSSNLLPDYTRNRIRQRIIPPLLKEFPAAEMTVSRSCQLLQRDTAYLDSLAEKLVAQADSNGRCPRSILSAADPAILSRALRLLAERGLGQSPDFFHTEQLLQLIINGQTGDRVQLSGGFALLTHHALCFKPVFAKRKAAPFSPLSRSSSLSEQTWVSPTPLHIGENQLPFGSLTLQPYCGKLNSLLKPDLLDCAKIIGKLIVRARQPGDRILCRDGHTRSLKKLFIDYKIDRDLRGNIPIVCDDLGPVWTPITGVSGRCLSGPATKENLILEFKGNV